MTTKPGRYESPQGDEYCRHRWYSFEKMFVNNEFRACEKCGREEVYEHDGRGWTSFVYQL